WWAWGLLAPWIVALDRRLPFSDRQLSRRIVSHLGFSALFTVAFLYVAGLLRVLLGLYPLDRLIGSRFFTGLGGMFLWNWLVYLLIVGTWHGFQYYERFLSGELRLERLERQFAEARLNALRMQLDPHFLFNALNTISSQLESDPKSARRMIEHLGDLLRHSLESRDKQEVPLAEELALLDHYLAIQKIRFGEHLKIEFCVSPEVRLARV